MPRLNRLFRRQWVPAPRDAVFAFFDRPENLSALTPPELGFRLWTPSPVPMHPGSVIDYTIRILGIEFRWTTLISEYDPPRRFVDVQIRGPYDFWHHTHRFEPSGDGTIIEDEVCYALPFRTLGRLLAAKPIRDRLDRIFDYRRDRIAEIFSGVPVSNGSARDP